MEYIKITEEVQQKYKDNPNVCPFCGSDAIWGGRPDASDDTIYRDVRCLNPNCKMTWTEYFSLTHINSAFVAKED